MQRNDLRRQRERDPAWIDFCSGRAQMLSLWFVLEESNPIICHMWKEKDLGWSCAYKWLIHWLKFLFFVLPISVFSVFLVLESGRILKTDYTTKIYELRNRSLRIAPQTKVFEGPHVGVRCHLSGVNVSHIAQCPPFMWGGDGQGFHWACPDFQLK